MADLERSDVTCYGNNHLKLDLASAVTVIDTRSVEFAACLEASFVYMLAGAD